MNLEIPIPYHYKPYDWEIPIVKAFQKWIKTRKGVRVPVCLEAQIRIGKQVKK